MASKSLDSQIFRYKLIYSMTGLVLGLFTMGIGLHLLTVDIYQLSSISWEVKIFGDGISVNDDNIAPGIVLFLVGLFVIIVTQHRIKRNREHDQKMLESQALRYQFVTSMIGLILGVLIMLVGIALVVNGTDGPADWAYYLLQDYFNPVPGEVLFLVGVPILIISRLMTKIYFSMPKQSKS